MDQLNESETLPFPDAIPPIDENNPPIEKQNFSFIEYFKYAICLKKNNPKILYYEDFRNEIISEENLLQNYIDIYQLIKICKIDENNFLLKRNK